MHLIGYLMSPQVLPYPLRRSSDFRSNHTSTKCISALSNICLSKIFHIKSFYILFLIEIINVKIKICFYPIKILFTSPSFSLSGLS